MRSIRIYAIKLDLYRPNGWRRAAIVGLPARDGVWISVIEHGKGPQGYADRIQSAVEQFVAGRPRDRILLPTEVVTELGYWDAERLVVHVNPRSGRLLDSWLCHEVEREDLEATGSPVSARRRSRAQLRATLSDVDNADRWLRDLGFR